MSQTMSEWLHHNRLLPGRITLDGDERGWFLGRWTLPPGPRTAAGGPDSSYGPVDHAAAQRLLREAGLQHKETPP